MRRKSLYSFDTARRGRGDRGRRPPVLRGVRRSDCRRRRGHRARHVATRDIERLGQAVPRCRRATKIAQAACAVDEVARRLLALAAAARAAGIGLTVDAEEADRLELSLAVFARVSGDSSLRDWNGLGIAVQAYQKRAPHVLRWLERLARNRGGHDTGPARQRRVLGHRDQARPSPRPRRLPRIHAQIQHGSLVPRVREGDARRAHAPHAAVCDAQRTHRCLRPRDRRRQALRIPAPARHGRGAVRRAARAPRLRRTPAASYAPVGKHRHLLPYLVRRLLENGANTSFVNRLDDDAAPVASLVADPFAMARADGGAGDPRIPPPPDLFGPERRNSRGRNLASGRDCAALAAELAPTTPGAWTASPMIGDTAGLLIEVDGKPKLWLGDNRVFRWHHDWPLTHGSIVHSVLMALERWLYEQIDHGRTVEGAVHRIVAESESLAFAGLLFDVGKKSPSLFAHALKPLFSAGVLWDWDFRVTGFRRTGQRNMLGFWGMQPQQLITLAQDWYRLPHRNELLLAPDGAIPRTMLSKAEFRPFSRTSENAGKHNSTCRTSISGY